MDESKILKDQEFLTEFVSQNDVIQLTNKIAEYLYTYTMRTRQFFNENYPKLLGGVGFWLAEQRGQTMLMYNVHPKQWNINRVTFALETEEKEFFQNMYAIQFEGK